MSNTVIFVAGRGTGKTTAAEWLRAKYGCDTIVDGWEPWERVVDGALHLTERMRVSALSPSVRVVSGEEAAAALAELRREQDAEIEVEAVDVKEPTAMQRRHMMIAFETLGLTTDAVLLSFAAVVVDPLTDSTESFSVTIDPRSQPGGKIDAGTVLWWLDQASKNPEAAKPLLEAVKMLDDDLPEDYTDEQEEAWYSNKAYSLDHVAQMFVGFCASLPEWRTGKDGGFVDMECWANGPLDHGWLGHMMTSTGLKNPVPYWQQRDYRTLRAMHPSVEADEHPELVEHTAHGDAMYQALHLAKLLRHQYGYPAPQYPGHDPFMPGDEVWEKYPWAMFAATDGNGDLHLHEIEPSHHVYEDDTYCGWAAYMSGDNVLVGYVGCDLTDEVSASSLRRRPERLCAPSWGRYAEDEAYDPASTASGDAYMPADEVWAEHEWAQFAATDSDGLLRLYKHDPVFDEGAEGDGTWWDEGCIGHVVGLTNTVHAATSLRRRPEHLIEHTTQPEDEGPDGEDGPWAVGYETRATGQGVITSGPTQSEDEDHRPA